MSFTGLIMSNSQSSLGDYDESPGRFMAEYVWISNPGECKLRSKTRTLEKGETAFTLEDCPVWNFDGSSTGQAPGTDSEVYLRPHAMFADPFRRENHIIVLCECVLPPTPEEPEMKPHPNNNRFECNRIMSEVESEQPWFGIEQEYTLMQSESESRPLGWPQIGYPNPQGPYYCGAGDGLAIGRDIVEDHYKACLYSGIKISGCNAEVMPGQWEFQVGPCTGIEMGDHLWMARYLLIRVCEKHEVKVTFDPKPVSGDWNGAGAHCNYSTSKTRDPATGIETMESHMVKLEATHKEHIDLYGSGNEKRMTGELETSDINTFSYGYANRGCSVRIPRTVLIDKCGYYEDRRPSANCDPYLVTRKIVQTTLQVA